MIKGALTLIYSPSFSESMVSFADLPFKFLLLLWPCFLDPLVLAFGIVKLLHPVHPKQRVLRWNRELCWYFPPDRNSIWDLCGTISKYELYCLSKRSLYFIDQQVITFDMFWDLISLHRKNALALLYFSKLEFKQMRHTFSVCLEWVFILFHQNVARMLPDNVAKKPCRGIFIFGLLRKYR